MSSLRRIVVGVAAVALVLALVGGGGWAAVLAQDATPGASPAADATPTPQIIEIPLEDVDGQQVGVATFEQTEVGVSVFVLIDEGVLEPGDHGIHVHETGLCDPAGDEPFASAGDHFNPTGAEHGAPETETSHVGDLGNLFVNEDGSAQFQITTDGFSIGETPPTLDDPDGSALIIHAMPDDLTSQPSGGSGDPVICGVVFPSASGTPAASPVAGTPAA